MLSIIIGILMSLGVINTGVEFEQLSPVQQELIINAWVDEADGIG